MSAKTPTPKPKLNDAADALDAAATHVAIGKVGKAHGLRGAFFVAGRDEPIPMAYGEVLIGSSLALALPTKLRSSQMQGERPLLLCSLAQFRDQAEALTGQSIFVERSRIKTKSHEMLWDDLRGALVVDAADAEVGHVHLVYYAGSCDIIEVHAVRGGKEQTLDIPLVDTYLAPGQALRDGRLRLSVSGEVFADIWQDLKPRATGTKPPA